mgnify:CR=1 FL=1
MSKEVEYPFFITFLILGILSYILIPPIKKVSILCGCRWYTNIGWKTGFCEFLSFSCVTFTLFFLVLDTVNRFYQQVLDGQPYSEAQVYGYILLAVFFLALICYFCGGEVIWAILTWSVISSLLVNQYISCDKDDTACFFLNVSASFMAALLISGILSAFMYYWIASVISNFRAAVSASFTVIISLCVIVLGFDNWDNYSLVWIYLVILGLTLIRVIWECVQTHFVCCIKYDQLEEE